MAKTPSKKSAKAPKKAAEGKKKKTRSESYSTYIYRVLLPKKSKSKASA